jgi:hypothetical protein
MSAETRSVRAKVAGLTARGVAPEHVEAACDGLRWARITDDGQSWPRPTAEQKAELRAILFADDDD